MSEINMCKPHQLSVVVLAVFQLCFQLFILLQSFISGLDDILTVSLMLFGC